MDHWNELERAARYEKDQAAQSQERLKEQSRQRLLKIISTKMRTAFIGALSAFEVRFGELWGHGKDVSELTREQKARRQMWEEARQNILNNGNGQLRALELELALYEILWKRYQTTLSLSDSNGVSRVEDNKGPTKRNS